MRLSVSEKEEIIRLVDRSELGVNKTLRELGIHKSTFYQWYKAYLRKGTAGFSPVQKTRQQWNSIPEEQWQLVVEVALAYPALSPRELAVKITDEQQVFISESSVYRILKAQGLVTTPAHILLSASKEFKNKTCFVHEMWQTDFTYLKVVGWGWYYLSTILDDYSRFIVHWELCRTMTAEDVERCVAEAMMRAGLGAEQRPRLLSDNGSCYIAQDLNEYLKRVDITHIRGRAQHPQTQGKIERYHRSMKNVVNLDHYYCPEELTQALKDFVQYYNHERYHESLDNVTPADVYFGKQDQILRQRETIKQQTLKQRRQRHLLNKPII